jgi:hypothetical protein
MVTDYSRPGTRDRFPSRGQDREMSAARPLSERGSIFLDARGSERALRVSWHSEADLVVLSLWRDNVCAASFRLSVEEVPELVGLLRDGLDHAYRHAPTREPA